MKPETARTPQGQSALRRNALLEIGSEEIPARFIPSAREQISRLLTQKLNESGIEFSSIEVWGTPRRLSALIQGIAPKSRDRVDVAVGPPPKAAQDEQGNWTAAATGFAKAQKVEIEKLILQQTPKGERFVALHSIKGQKTELALKEIFPFVIQNIVFPKSMIWDAKDVRFARPIRWIVALFNSSVVRFKAAGINSDRTTVGLLSLGGLKIPISKADRYKLTLQGRCILVDPEERKKNIRHQIEALTKKIKAAALVEADHLEEVANLTEYPVCILGHFPESYLKLPREILINVLKRHQRFFPIESSQGQLTNNFIGVRNGTSDSQEEVKEGYERVILARLADAEFFYEKDRRTPLEELVPKLAGVGFHEKLGTMRDKILRVQKSVEELGPALGLDAETTGRASRAAYLAKADLLTQMVGEFPDLQGIAGRFYSENREPKGVADAIEQHYWPLTSESELPRESDGRLVSLVDKMDTLAADFSIGLIPSGSADPYGLRRLAIGVLRILMETRWAIGIETLVKKSTEALKMDPARAEKTVKDLKTFFIQRCTHWFGNQGFRPDEVEAVLSINGQSLSVLQEKLRGFKTVRGRKEFDFLANAAKRTRNILHQAREKGLLPENQEDSLKEIKGAIEESLHKTLGSISPRFHEAVDRHEFEQALLELAKLKEPVDAFFEGVMVMVDDPAVRSQRLALLMAVQQLFDRLADFSKLQGSAAAPNN